MKGEHKEANPWLSVSITNLKIVLGENEDEGKEMKYVNKQIRVNDVLTK